jgi:hypothetical protein
MMLDAPEVQLGRHANLACNELAPSLVDSFHDMASVPGQMVFNLAACH